MCGIVGYLGSDSFIEPILQGLRLLQNRGYDSVGVGFIHSDEIHVVKYASTNTNNALDTVEAIVNEIPICQKATVAIGHTRWATHGGKTDTNAHPHLDNAKKVSIAHNGIIENFKELRAELMTDGYTFISQTDTEVISVLIGKYLAMGDSMQRAIQKAVGRLQGTWALVILNADSPNKMWITRNGSPLLLGMEEGYIMVASEQIAFGHFIKSYLYLDNHDLIEISLEGGSISYEVVCAFDSLQKDIGSYKMNQKMDHGSISATPAPYPYWMLKEIEEQPDAIFRAFNRGGRIESPETVKLGGLDACKSRLMELDHLILLGCGTSFHAGWWSLELFKSLTIMDTVSIYDGAEFQKRDIPQSGKTGVILLSQSGETKDLHRCIQIATENSLMTIGVVNVTDSLIARETECGVYLNAGREVAVASTKSFTNQCVVLALLAVWFSQNLGTCEEKRRKIISDLHQLPIQMSNVFTKENEEKIRILVNGIRTTKSMFLLGKGKDEAIAKEGALKLKEIARIHAEGYSTSALKHGPFGLLEGGMPVIVMDIGEKYREKTASSIEEIKAREADIYLLRDNSEESFFIFESKMTFGSLLANVCLQWVSYEYAVINGFSPDYPRNLAKVVTVE